jgi:hypothetical protein
MDLREVGWGNGLDRSGSGLKLVVGCCGCGNEPFGATKCGEFLDQLPKTVSYSGRTLLHGVSYSHLQLQVN